MRPPPPLDPLAVSRFAPVSRKFRTYLVFVWFLLLDVTHGCTNALSSFSSFCEEFHYSKFSKDIHWIPQSELLCDDVGNIIPDFVGRYENLNDDLKTISDIIGIDINVGHHRKTNRTYYKQMFSSKTRDIIENFFSVDLNKFNYEF